MKLTTQKAWVFHLDGEVEPLKVGEKNVSEIEYSQEKLFLVTTAQSGGKEKKTRYYGLPFITQDGDE